MKLLKHFSIFFVGCIFLGAVTAWGFYKFLEANLPDVATLKEVQLQKPMLVYTADDKLIAQFGEKRRIPMTLQEYPDLLLQAFIATEDSRFYDHSGFDPVGIARAIFVYVKSSGNRKEGASTITQQLARNYFLSSERKLMRKAREIVLAIKIEKNFSKDEILEMYLNKIALGQRSYGVGAAAYVYFGKTPKELTLSEMATIAGLPKAPSRLNPITSLKQATLRRNVVLYRMLDVGFITKEQYQQTLNEKLVAKYHEQELQASAPYLAEMVRQEMVRQFGEEEAYNKGYKVYTTIRSDQQTAATQALQNRLFEYDVAHGYRGPEKRLWDEQEQAWDKDEILKELKKHRNVGPLYPAVVIQVNESVATLLMGKGEQVDVQAARAAWAHAGYVRRTRQQGRGANLVMKTGELVWLREKKEQEWSLAQIPKVNASIVSLDATNGAILTLVGGFDFNRSKFNRATQSIRQAGSSIKPFIYAAALDRGMTMATILNDLPITRWNVGQGNRWRPKNSPNVYEGPLRLRVGMGKSKNVMIVRAMRAMGVEYAAEYLERFGFVSRRIEHTESLALGAATLTPLQLVRGYAVFVNGGYLLSPYFIQRVEDDLNKMVFVAEPKIVCDSCNLETRYSSVERSTFWQGLQQEEDVTTETDEGEDIYSEPSQDIAPAPETETVPDIMTLPALNKTELVAQIDDLNSAYAPRVIDKEVAFLIKDGLKSNIWGEAGGNWTPTGWRARVLGRQDIGGKTGTTNQVKDAWFAGFGANTVAAVWVGFDDYKERLGLNSGGAQSALPIWVDYMKVALKNAPVVKDELPSGIVRVNIDMATGRLATDYERRKMEYFIRGTEPTSKAIHEVDMSIYDEQTGVGEDLF